METITPKESITPRDIAESIRSGDYFRQSQAWYTTIYMSILSERFFFIVLTMIAAITMFFAALAVIGLMPITKQVPFFYVSRDINSELPVMTPLRTDEMQSVNDALRRYFVSAYIKNREEYSLDKLQAQFRMIQKHSDENAFSVYRRFIDPSNPRSPITLYQRLSIKNVSVISISIQPDPSKPGHYNATAEFSARVKSFGKETVSTWQAQMLFNYTDLNVDQTEEKADNSLKVTPMTFTVLEYTSRELR
ncbi:MAG: VirB8/TrbF family protein [Rickettsiales bacterium]